MSVVVENLSKSFGTLRALRDVDLRVERGTLAVLLGPSGCGKSTLLRVIAGFETPERGRLALDGEDVTSRPLGKRDVGFVFQNYALFPHMTVAQNVGFALSIRKRRQERSPSGSRSSSSSCSFPVTSGAARTSFRAVSANAWL